MRSSKLVVSVLAMMSAGTSVVALIACNSIIGTRDLSFDADAETSGPNDGQASGSDGSKIPSDGASNTNDGATLDSAAACTGIDLTTNGQNCGVCGHDCLGGECAASKCQPVAIISSTGEPYALAVDATNVYFSDVGQTTGILYALPKNSPAGTTPTQLLTTPDPLLYDLAVDGTTLYFSYGSSGNKGAIEAVSNTGTGRRGVLLDAAVPRGISVDTSNVYWATPDETVSSILQVAKDTAGAKAVTLSPSEPDTEFTFLDGQELYWSGSDQSTIRRCTLPMAGCTPSTFITGLSGQNAMAADKQFLFYSDFDTIFYSVKTGTTASGTSFVSTQPQPISIAVDTTEVYWANTGTSANNFADGDIRRCQISAAGSPTCKVANGEILATSTKNPRVIALDATAVYWTVQYEGTVYRLAR